MKRTLACRLECNNQRTSLFQVMLKVAPCASEDEGLKSILLKVFLHGGGVYAARLMRVERTLDGDCVRIRLAARLPGPILHDHGNAGRTATLGRLFYERDVEPHRVTRAEQDAEQQRDKRRRKNATHP